MRKLKVALLGLADDGQHYLSAIRQDDLFELIAVYDRDVNVLRDISESTGVRGYEDIRSLIVELSHDGLDVLFIALEPYESYEFVQMAAGAGIAVFHKPPFARNVSEARSLVACFQSAGLPLVVARTWHTDPSLSLALIEEVGHVQLATAEVASTKSAAGWRGDSVRAGGGVLLHGAYAQLDMLVSVMGLPEEVFAQCALTGQAGDVHNYDTEDMIALALRFSTHRAATLTAYRNAHTSRSRIRWVGPRGVAETTSEVFAVRTTSDNVEEDRQVISSISGISKALHAFGVALHNHSKQVSAGEDHLATLAVLEAAYLSSRTGASESVGRFLTAE